MRRFGFSLLVISLVVLWGQVQGATRRMLLDVQTVPLAWGSSALPEKLAAELSFQPKLRLSISSSGENWNPPFPENRQDTDSLLNWGTEMGGRFLLVVTIDDEYLTRKKTFSLPLIFHRYKNVGIITGEFRLVDLQKGRLLGAEPFEIELTAHSKIQAAIVDNRNDPSLHLNATEKSHFFHSLEDDLSKWLVKRVTALTQGR